MPVHEGKTGTSTSELSLRCGARRAISSAMRRIVVIVNPAAGAGRGARMLGDIRRAFARVGVRAGDIRVSAAPGNESALATRAIEDGCTTLVAVGGDGTWSNVANAILRGGSDCRLAIAAAGTGNDFVKSLGPGVAASDIDRTAQLAAAGPDTWIDVGRVEDFFFINAMGVGFDAAVLADVARTRWPRGRLVYAGSALRRLVSYEGIHIAANGVGRERYLMYVVANGRHFGGAFRIAPTASLQDAQLDVVAIGDMPPLDRLPLLAAAMRGAHARRAGVITQRKRCVMLSFDQPPMYDRDGELQQARGRTLEITCVPRALRVVGA